MCLSGNDRTCNYLLYSLDTVNKKMQGVIAVLSVECTHTYQSTSDSIPPSFIIIGCQVKNVRENVYLLILSKDGLPSNSIALSFKVYISPAHGGGSHFGRLDQYLSGF